MEDERDETEDTPRSGLNLTTTTSRASDDVPPRRPSPQSSIRRNFERREDESTNDEDSDTDTDAGVPNDPEPVKVEQETSEEPHDTNVVATPPARPADNDGRPVGPRKTRVVIRDAAWSTWWAILYWIYTDIVFFAPLSSSFMVSTSPPGHGRTASTASFHTANGDGATRRDWIRQWVDERGGTEEGATGPRAVSAKAVYRLADKLDLPELKLRAFQHICANLAAQNIPAEVFSRFSTTFEEVRKVQVAFFLKHWSEIKKSDTMTQIWTQIRLGKHVGFEEGESTYRRVRAWVLIVSVAVDRGTIGVQAVLSCAFTCVA